MAHVECTDTKDTYHATHDCDEGRTESGEEDELRARSDNTVASCGVEYRPSMPSARHIRRLGHDTRSICLCG